MGLKKTAICGTKNKQYNFKRNMKKEYMKPQVEVVRVKTCLPLADSLHGLSNTVGLDYGGGGSSSGRSRDYDDWDEE